MDILLWIIFLLQLVFFGVMVYYISNRQSGQNRQTYLKENIQEYIMLMKDALSEKMTDMSALLKEQLEHMNTTMDKQLSTGFQKTQEVYQKLLEKIARIDQAQKNIEQLSSHVVNLQDTLTDSKQKGIFGEVQLEHIVSHIFGDAHDFYQMEYTFPDKTRVDCVVHTPQGKLCIDAKFPLKYWHAWQDEIHTNNNTHTTFQKEFIRAVKQQIDALSSKYSHQKDTLPTTFLFLPSEAIFSSIHSQCFDLIDYAHRHHISIVSPTTLSAMLMIVLSTTQTIETQKQAKIIQEELDGLQIEFARFHERWSKFTKDIKSVHGDIDKLDITNTKILQKFEKIHRLEIEK